MRLLPLLLAACAPYPEGLLRTPEGSGPTVVVDWDHEPLPVLPFPNDLATRPDPTSRTGLRLNISTVTHTAHETEVRQMVDREPGWGIYSPITVAFDELLDLDDIAARHLGDSRTDASQFDDDAIFVVNIDPASPDYGKPVALDVGHGRFPYDVPRPDRYFANDARVTSPTLVFDTVDEDINQNGVLDWGEDTDNDGVLDKPNVWPEGGDPRADLLEWYERETNTLMVRPIKPLREGTRYAVVLTSRLRGAASGEPVRSPWDFVHHTRQTEALAPLPGLLPSLGLSLNELAFAWVFTTGTPSQDLVDLSLGLRKGEGPFRALREQYPPTMAEAATLHALPDGSDPALLPVTTVLDELVNLGVFDPEEGAVLIENYAAFSAGIVGGAFTTPYLLSDKDDGGAWDADEWWQVDPHTGQTGAAPHRVVFTCLLPKEPATGEGPAPTVFFGHGYGSSRFDLFGFGWAMNRLGFAACAFDFPGHGSDVDPEQDALIRAYLGSKGLEEFYEHLLDSRMRDLDNDGYRQSGGDQWSADVFHTRDMVRQAALDQVQFYRTVEACGEGTMTRPDGSTSASCDWNDDGQPDIGGPMYIMGGSLGGINTAVAAGILPEVRAWAPIVPGAGIVDTALRTEIGGAVEAMHGRLLSPLFVGIPDDAGGLQIQQLIVSVTELITLPVATLPDFPAGGRVRVENLRSGVIREGLIPQDGRFRVGIAADAADAYERRALGGMPDEGPGIGERFVLDDPTLAGDPIVLHIEAADGSPLYTIDSWEAEVEVEGLTYPAGSALVAGAEGNGYIRGTPDLRRAAMFFAGLIEAGDPIAYAPLYVDRPIEGGPPINILVMPTHGDMLVPINAGVALARAAGIIDSEAVDPALGSTPDQYILDRSVVHGLEEFGPYTCTDAATSTEVPCLYDLDDLDNGTDGLGAPTDIPLRLTLQTESGVSGLRMPYVERTGTHGFGLPNPTLPFDINTFAVMQAASYFASDGQTLSDDPCQEDASCAWIPALPVETP